MFGGTDNFMFFLLTYGVNELFLRFLDEFSVKIQNNIIMENLDGRLVIGVSSRALFDLEAENEIFEKYGVTKYRKYHGL